MAETLLRQMESLLSAPERVDLEKGIVYGVKIIGRTSKNKREFTEECIDKEHKKYDGLSVNLDHGPRGKSRGVTETVGWLDSPIKVADGAMGNLNLFLKHPYASFVMEAAVRRPQAFGLSQVADLMGNYRRSDGVFVVESMPKIHFVDIVTSPATTGGFFEDTNMDPNDPRAMLGQAIGLLLASSKPEDHALGQKIAKLLKPDAGGDGAGNGAGTGALTEEVANKLLSTFKIKSTPGVVKMLLKCESVNEALEVIESIAPVAPNGTKVESAAAGALTKIPKTTEEVTRFLKSR